MAGQNWHLGKTAGALSGLSASRTRLGRRLLSERGARLLHADRHVVDGGRVEERDARVPARGTRRVRLVRGEGRGVST